MTAPAVEVYAVARMGVWAEWTPARWLVRIPALNLVLFVGPDVEDPSDTDVRIFPAVAS